MSTPQTPSRAVPGTAGWGRRIGALFIDWIACYGVAFFILRDIQHSSFGALVTLLFLLESTLGVALSGGSFGQLALRIRVLHLTGRPLSLLRAFWRQLLVCLVIPPLVFREDGRGLHDILNDSAAFSVQTPNSRGSTT